MTESRNATHVLGTDALTGEPISNVTVDQMSVYDICAALHRLGLSEHVNWFRRTDGALLEKMSLDDVRRRMRGDEEAADVFWVWLENQRRRNRYPTAAPPAPPPPRRAPSWAPVAAPQGTAWGLTGDFGGTFDDPDL
jgi:hypothetical protein